MSNPDLPHVGYSVSEVELLALANIVMGGRSSNAEDLLARSKNSEQPHEARTLFNLLTTLQSKLREHIIKNQSYNMEMMHIRATIK